MSKRIVLCFDGTCNEPEDAVQKHALMGMGELKDNSISNVLKLHLLLGGDLRKRTVVSDQMSFYYPGVGTYGTFWEKMRNKTVAPPEGDVGRIIKDAIRDIYENYEPGDLLFVFGFSRGAAIARRLCSVLAKTFPALDKDQTPRIRFMGVFDTVAAIKRPNLLKEEVKPASDVVFENRTISPLVDEALHILSVDERRIAFYPTLMNKDDEKVTEVWFPGAHSDIGGGYRLDGLSDLTLQFMLDEIQRRKLGLEFVPAAAIDYQNIRDDSDIVIQYDDVIVQPNYLGKNHEQHALTKLKERFLDHRSPRVRINDVHSIHSPVIHHSVFDRINDDPEYQPQALEQKHLNNPYTGKMHGLRVWYNADTIVSYRSVDEVLEDARHAIRHLEPGDSHSFTVHANQVYNRARISLLAGETYRFTVDMDQKWFDSSIEAGPDGWDRKKADLGYFKRAIIRLGEGFRRHSDAEWFEVIGTINRDERNVFRILEHTDPGSDLMVRTSGELFAFANDMMSKYGNNLGSIEVTVTRMS